MTHPKLKVTIPNIISLWAGQDTPIRVYKIKMNPDLWAACQRVNCVFQPSSGAKSVVDYSRADLVRFAKEVQMELHRSELVN